MKRDPKTTKKNVLAAAIQPLEQPALTQISGGCGYGQIYPNPYQR